MRKKLTAALVCLGLAIGSLWLAVVSAHVAASQHAVILTTSMAGAANTATGAAQQSPQAVMLVINEYLASPPAGIAGDANGDGTRSATQDEFIELVNNDTASLNIGGFTISDATQVRFTIPAGKIIPPGEAAIIFGGGTPTGAFGNAAANGLVFAVGGSGLSLNDGGDTITVKDTTATTVATLTYTGAEGGAGQALTRSPDITGSFVTHSTAAGAGGRLFSPGTRVDGSPFTTPLPIITSISPNAAVAGSGDVPIIVTGNNFQMTSQVRVDGNVVSTTFTDAMHLNATVPTAATNVVGGHTVTVENPGPATSNSVTFTVLSSVGINEYLADPPGSAAGDLIGDANGDGVRSSSDDEFIEVVNRTNAAINVGGYALRDTDAVRFTFPVGTMIPAGEAAIVFGGGTPTGEFGNAHTNGLVFTSPLSLNNTGDTISLLDAASQTIESITYGSSEGGADQSINRNPEIFGTVFATHTSIPGAGGRLFSPGTLVNGAAFTLGPRLTDLMPDNAPRNAPAFDMTIHGSNFESTAKAFIDGSMVTTLFVSSGELTAHVPASVTTVAGAHNVQVLHEGGNRSNVLVLTITMSDPVIDSISPDAAIAGSGDVPITVTGHNFQALSKVRVDGNMVSTTFTDAMHLSAAVPTAVTNVPGAHAVTVENPGNVVSNVATFTVLSFVGINEYLADPPDGLAGDANGDGTRDSADDEFVEVVNRTNAPIDISSFKIRDADSVRFTFPIGTMIPAGEAAIVFGGGTPTGDFGNAHANGLVFTTGSGGLSLNNGGDTISLLDAASQTIESITFTSTEGNANQSINRNPEIFGTTFVTHTSIPGAGGRLFSPGAQVNGAPFTTGPRITNILPDSAPLNTPPFDVAIHGSNFESTAKAFIDGNLVMTTFVNSGELTAHVPASVTSAGGGHNVQVFHEGGNRSNIVVLTIIATNPMIDSISPSAAIVGSGNVEITVTGHDFQSLSKVRVDGNMVSTTFTSGTQLMAIVPASVTNAPGAHTVTVQNPDLVVSNAVTFAVLGAVGINEYLADPPDGLAGDANGDGARDSADDEFVEVVNRTSAPINIGGFTIHDATALRFTFPAGTMIPAGEVAVVFGGGTPTGEFGNAHVNGLVFKTGSAGLSLNNGGDTISLLDAASQTIESITFGSTEGGANQSINRNPEIFGTTFVTHSSIAASGGRLFSPGAQVNGAPFTTGPRITNILPDNAPLHADPFDMTIHGSNFESTAKAFIDGNLVTTTFVSSGELTAQVPTSVTAGAGAHNVDVRHEGGNRSNVLVLTIIPPPPVLLEVLPRAIPQGSASFPFFLRGENFFAGVKVLVNGTAVTTTLINSTELRATVPASFTSSLGTRLVRVRNSDGKESNDLSFEVIAASARITSLTPTGVIAGSPAFTLTIAGAGFKTGAVVLFDDTLLATTFVSATQVRAEVPAALVTTPRLHGVQERNADGGLSNQEVFFVLPDPPRAFAIDPLFVIEGADDTVITITGEKFVPGAVAQLVENNLPGPLLDTTFVTSGRLTARVPAQFTQIAGVLTIQVENPDFGTSNRLTLKVFIRNPLVINEYLADPPGSAASDLIGDANGDGSRSSSQDEFVEIINRTSEAIDLSGCKLFDADEVRHVFAKGTIVPPFEVVVVFGGGTPTGAFGNAADEHLVFKASTGGLSLNNGGDTIKLTDAQGRTIDEIKFGWAEGGANQSINRDPDGNGATFARHTEVAHDTSRLFSPGTRVTGEPFSVRPHVRSLTPASVHAGSASFTLAVAGSDFAPGATVLLGNTPLATVYRSDTLLEAEVSAALVSEGGALEIRVRNPKGELSSAAILLVFDDPPRLTRLTPDKTGTGAENLELRLEGERFERGAVVMIGSTAMATEFVSKTLLKAILPASLFTKVGTINAQVKNADGNLSNTLTLAVDYGPLLTRLSPKRVRAGSGAVELTIGGVAFKQGITLFVNDVAMPTTFVSDTSLTARIPAEMTAQAGKLTLQARHADGGRSNRATLRVVQ
ncbi:MAG: large repetitive protein [Blastocatellia bacterium]